MDDYFIRTRILLGQKAMEKLADSHVAVFGLGGVGGSCVEALARSGVGALSIVDNGEVEASNINRQIIATLDTIGRAKTDVMAERIAAVNPSCHVICHNMFYVPDTADRLDLSQYDYVVDAVDTLTAKLHLIECAYQAGIPLMSCMGAGNKLDPTAFKVADIYDTHICPLAKRIRKECRKRGIEHLKVVYSTEAALEPLEAIEPPPGRNSLPGSIAFVPPVAGHILAGEVVRDIAGGLA